MWFESFVLLINDFVVEDWFVVVGEDDYVIGVDFV